MDSTKAWSRLSPLREVTSSKKKFRAFVFGNCGLVNIAKEPAAALWDISLSGPGLRAKFTGLGLALKKEGTGSTTKASEMKIGEWGRKERRKNRDRRERGHEREMRGNWTMWSADWLAKYRVAKVRTHIQRRYTYTNYRYTWRRRERNQCTYILFRGHGEFQKESRAR